MEQRLCVVREAAREWSEKQCESTLSEMQLFFFL